MILSISEGRQWKNMISAYKTKEIDQKEIQLAFFASRRYDSAIIHTGMGHFLKKPFRHAKETGAQWFREHGQSLMLFVGVAASLILAFEGGFLIGKDRQSAPIYIEEPADPCVCTTVPSDQRGGNALMQNSQNSVETVAGDSDNLKDAGDKACVFVGSRNSDKYHLPKCSWAKRIKPENRICFTSAADAESKGYKPGCIE